MLANDADPDDGRAALRVATVAGEAGAVGRPVATPAGTLVLGADGSYAFTPDRDSPVLRALGPGQSLFVEVPYTVADPSGATAVAVLRVAVAGVNDPPVAADDTARVLASGTASGDVLANDSDPDAGQTVRVVGVGAASFGTLTMRPDGSWTYARDPANSALAALPPGATLTERVPYTIADDAGATTSAFLALEVTAPDAGSTVPPPPAPTQTPAVATPSAAPPPVTTPSAPPPLGPVDRAFPFEAAFPPRTGASSLVGVGVFGPREDAPSTGGSRTPPSRPTRSRGRCWKHAASPSACPPTPSSTATCPSVYG